ncbi:S1/P1 nuclease [Rhizobium laguerreae]|uniref:S1/P1 nuclease n=1 Tax=Rhizobium laguerreae TaxID=1076926 RepID=UPI001C9219B6|nr:S1/P1 nuclease [Rhizobium laguerreae]MBY3233391.1 S1/P1 nuclease [Rhizobium laguerreae]
MRLSTMLACVLALLPAQAMAWGDGGHSIVAEIAEHRLNPHSIEVAQKLLKSEYSTAPVGPVSLASIASWADDYRSEHKETTNWHFVDIPINVEGKKPEEVEYDESRDCKSVSDPLGTCLVKAVEEQLRILSQPVDFGDAGAVTRHAMALKFFVHLYGDMAQPLHCAERDDDGGGNGFHVFYSGPKQNSLEVRTNFHKVWDSLILGDVQWNWNAYVRDLEQSWFKDKDESTFLSGSVVDWVNECHQQAVRAYGLVPMDLTLGQKQLKVEKMIADEQLAKAGVRLADALNKAFASYP